MDPTLILAQAEAAPLSLGLRVPLSLMHFLEFAIWGAWWVVLGNYLNQLQFSRRDIGRVYATMSIGSIIAPMLVGMTLSWRTECQKLRSMSQCDSICRSGWRTM